MPKRTYLNIAAALTGVALLAACGSSKLNDQQIDQVADIAGSAASDVYPLAERMEQVEAAVSEDEDRANDINDRLDAIEARLDELDGGEL